MSRNNLVRRTFETLLMLNADTVNDSNILFNFGYYSSYHDDHALFSYTIKFREGREYSEKLKSIWNKYKEIDKEKFIKVILKNRHLFKFELIYSRNGHVKQSFSGTYDKVFDFFENIISPSEFITLIQLSQ